MRIWSIHPRFLDTKGLVACWRETLLAQSVLLGKTKGYKNHPQLNRFKSCRHTISNYLFEIFKEAESRGFKFDKTKILELPDSLRNQVDKIPVTLGQVSYEYSHLQKKLKQRDIKKYQNNPLLIKYGLINPIFELVDGRIENWEKVKGENV